MADEKKPLDLSRRDFLSSTGKVAAASVFAGAAPLDAQPVSDEETVAFPEDCVRPDREWQYKRLCKTQMARLEDGNIDGAITCLTSYNEANPVDVEYMYGLAVGYAMKGDLARATTFVQRAVDGGLPFGRFLAGPRKFLQPLYDHPEFQELALRYGNELVHGPLLGSVTHTTARFWVRTWHESSFLVMVSTSPDMLNPLSTAMVQTQAAQDYTAVAAIEGLTPDTTYYYKLTLAGNTQQATYTFKTFPAERQSTSFSIGFGGCAGYTPWHERIWRLIAQYEFPLFMLTGDNVYIDDPTRPGVQDYTYYRRQSRPEFRELVAGTSIAAIWDDHEFGDNDSWGGPAIDEPEWKIPVWKVFKNNWNNPSYAGGDAQPGCWFSFSIADVDIFMLDDRYYRDNHKEPPTDRPATMLGPDQKAWLYDALKRSTGTFKMLVTSVPWAYGVKPGSNDPWQGFKEEREEIFSFLADHKINGVFLLSGDRHRADLWKIERPDGYPLYDFENGRLTNLHTHDLIPGAIFGYNEKCTFGRLRFNTAAADPEVIYDIINIDDELVYSFPLKLSEISHH